MIRGYKILTVTHHTEKLNQLGQYAFNCEDTVLPTRLNELKDAMQIEELMYLATCNRIMYFVYTNQKLTSNFIQSFFQNVNPDFDFNGNLLEKINVLEGTDAIEHLFEVAASMNSLVVGEREILRQLREAYQKCYDLKLTGDHIRLAMRSAVEGAKDIYANTRIGEKPISIVSLAIQKLLGAKISRNADILLIGAGQTNTLVSKFLTKHEFKNVTVFNRSLPKAKQLSAKFTNRAFTIADLDNYKNGFDVIIICTGATEPIIKSDLYQKLLNGDTSNKLVIDLSIPNNIHRDVVDNFDVNYVEIEDLRTLAKANMKFRENEVVKGRTMIQRKLDEFGTLHQQRQIEKAMKDVPTKIKAVKSHAINKVFKKDLENVDEETKALIERMMTYMEKQCIGIPMKAAVEYPISNS